MDRKILQKYRGSPMALNRPLLIVLLALSLVAAACGSDSSTSLGTGDSSGGDGPSTSPAASLPADSQPDDDGQPVVSNVLIGTRWVISHIVIAGGEKQSQPPGEPATIEFESSSIFGSAGCNQYRVDWDSAEVDQLSLTSVVAITEMACVDAEDWFEFTNSLGGMTEWSITGDTLTLSDDSENSIVATSGASDGQADTNPGLVDTDLTEQLIGLSETAAGELADAAGRPWRVVARDGEFFPVTADYSEDRLNFTIVNDKVVKVEPG